MYGCVINRPAQVNHTVRSVHGADRKRRKIIAALKRKFLMNLCVYMCVYMGMTNEAPSIEFHAPFVPHWSEVPGYMGTPAPPAIHTYIHTQLRRMVIEIHTILRANHLPCMHCSHWNQTLLKKHVCMSLCMYVLCMYVHMYVCIYACIYEYE